MKKKLLCFLLALLACAHLVAASNEVTVTASVEGKVNNSALRGACRTAAMRNAVQKYLNALNSNFPEKVVIDATAEYAAFIDADLDVEELSDDMTFEDGVLSGTYLVTINQEAIAQWLKGRGVDMNALADGTSMEIIVVEEAPDIGAMKFISAAGTGLEGGAFFFTRYTMFQRRVRDALVEKVGTLGLDVILLEDNDAYEEFKEVDPVLVGVSFDPDVSPNGNFKTTPNFIKTIRDNNPDTIALYYRLDTIALDPTTKKIMVSASLNIKNLSKNTTSSLGSGTYNIITSNTEPMLVIEDIAMATVRALNIVLNGKGMAEKVQQIIKSMSNAQAEGPIKVVINVSEVDSSIRTRLRVAIRKALEEAEVCTRKACKIRGNTLSFTSENEDYSNPDDLWIAIFEALESCGVEATDDQMTLNGNTMTIKLK